MPSHGENRILKDRHAWHSSPLVQISHLRPPVKMRIETFHRSKTGRNVSPADSKNLRIKSYDTMRASWRIHWRYEIPRAKLRIPSLDSV